jgi:hypothetical protein
VYLQGKQGVNRKAIHPGCGSPWGEGTKEMGHAWEVHGPDQPMNERLSG